MKIHDLKTWPEYFFAVERGIKTFEVRKHDRGFECGDGLRLHEYDPNRCEYTGRVLFRQVGYIAACLGLGLLAEGVVVMGLMMPSASALERFGATAALGCAKGETP